MRYESIPRVTDSGCAYGLYVKRCKYTGVTPVPARRDCYRSVWPMLARDSRARFVVYTRTSSATGSLPACYEMSLYTFRGPATIWRDGLQAPSVREEYFLIRRFASAFRSYGMMASAISMKTSNNFTGD